MLICAIRLFRRDFELEKPAWAEQYRLGFIEPIGWSTKYRGGDDLHESDIFGRLSVREGALRGAA